MNFKGQAFSRGHFLADLDQVAVGQGRQAVGDIHTDSRQQKSRQSRERTDG
ncbi:hypothetical protein ACXO77_04260 [Lactobacillus delbrueckii subsp. bulgaricus]